MPTVTAPSNRPVEVSDGSGLGKILDAAEGRRRLAAYVTPKPIEEWAGQALRAREIDHELGIPRAALRDWHEKGLVIGLLNGRRNYVYPVEQFIDKRPVDGLSEVLGLSPDPRSAWLWLVQQHPNTGGERPIDLLRRGKLHAVIDAARGTFAA